MKTEKYTNIIHLQVNDTAVLVYTNGDEVIKVKDRLFLKVQTRHSPLAQRSFASTFKMNRARLHHIAKFMADYRIALLKLNNKYAPIRKTWHSKLYFYLFEKHDIKRLLDAILYNFETTESTEKYLKERTDMKTVLKRIQDKVAIKMRKYGGRKLQ